MPSPVVKSDFMRLSKELLESTYKPPPPSAFAKKNTKKQKPEYDATKRYRVLGVIKDLIPKCQVCGTRIRKCVILFDEISHEEIIVGSECAAIMLNWTLGQVERKAKKVQQEVDKEAEQAEWNRIFKNRHYDLLKRFWTNFVRTKSDKRESDSEKWKVRFRKQLGLVARDIKEPEAYVIGVLEKRGWKLEKHGVA